jgi:hypothetical protein
MQSRRILSLVILTFCLSPIYCLGIRVASTSNALANAPVEHSNQQSITPTPTYDPLAIPTLPEHPTDFERGKNLYYYHCMPCHGDVGQGLTDAWRMVWEEDHRNCWGRGCHGGRLKDEGFPIPTIIPAIMAPYSVLDRYPDFEALVRYLKETHPPQKPGKLEEAEYRALVVYVWVSNDRPMTANVTSWTDTATVTLSATPENTPTKTRQAATPTVSAETSTVSLTEDHSDGIIPRWNMPVTAIAGLALILVILFTGGIVLQLLKNK